jgi:CheY-like chemotaxis protein
MLIDLHNPGLAACDLMRDLPQPRPFVVGYGSHVDTATLQAAREAGFDLVLPRSKFVDALATSLAEWFGAPRPRD